MKTLLPDFRSLGLTHEQYVADQRQGEAGPSRTRASFRCAVAKTSRPADQGALQAFAAGLDEKPAQQPLHASPTGGVSALALPKRAPGVHLSRPLPVSGRGDRNPLLPLAPSAHGDLLTGSLVDGFAIKKPSALLASPQAMAELLGQFKAEDRVCVSCAFKWRANRRMKRVRFTVDAIKSDQTLAENLARWRHYFALWTSTGCTIEDVKVTVKGPDLLEKKARAQRPRPPPAARL